MLLEEINALNLLPVWGYILIFIGTLILSPVLIVIAAFSGGSVPDSSKDFVIVGFIMAALTSGITFAANVHYSPVQNFSKALEQDYGLKASEGVSRDNLFKGKEFIAKTSDDQSKLVRVEKNEYVYEIYIDGKYATK